MEIDYLEVEVTINETNNLRNHLTGYSVRMFYSTLFGSNEIIKVMDCVFQEEAKRARFFRLRCANNAKDYPSERGFSHLRKNDMTSEMTLINGWQSSHCLYLC